MSFSCDLQSLKNALSSVEKIVPTKSTIPILEGIVFNAKENTLFLSASNINTDIEISIPATVGIDASFVLIGKRIIDILRYLTDGIIKFSYDKGKGLVLIEKDITKYECLAFDEKEFPKKEFLKEGKKIEIDNEKFIECVKQTIFSVSSDEGKGVLVGEKIEIENNEISFIAIDGFRIAIKKTKIENAKELEILIHAKELKEIVKILEKAKEETINLYIDEKSFSLYIDNIKIRSKLLEGTYVNYKEIFPKNEKTEIIIEKENFENAIKRVSSIMEDKNTSGIKLDFVNDILTISADNEGQTAEEKIKIKKTGDDIFINFNIKFIEEILSVIDDENIKINLIGQEEAGIILPEKGEEYKFLILPIKL
ncbi:MAG: DNA polymerase III subunit beta [Clostridiales Family XIII bacterium]|jgi:DNA polymerase-3 subunit beta|nr:DNA polymerase III subunit beta [Clostridiales Family XIII bacterium]